VAVADAVVDAALTASMMRDAQNVVVDLYDKVLDRAPDPKGYIGWIIRIGAGEEIFWAFWNDAQAELATKTTRASRARKAKAAPAPRARANAK